MAGSEEGKLALLTSLLTHGAAVVQDSPVELYKYSKLLKSLGSLRITNWGEWFAVVAKPAHTTHDTSQADAAYSNLSIPLHVDGPYNENPLLFQVLQCLKQSLNPKPLPLNLCLNPTYNENPLLFQVLQCLKQSLNPNLNPKS